VSYHRVIPRDLFNEASLLKCYGRLWILLDQLGNQKAKLSEGSGKPFKIEQNEADGVALHRPLNSRQAWPLYAVINTEECEVFDDEGNLSHGFLEFIQE
jgi:hypothetical protein